MPSVDKNNLYFESNEAENLGKYTETEPDYTIVTTDDVLKSYGFRDPITREILFGTMTVNEPENIKINPSESYIIPKGYHNGTGKVYVGDLSEYTPGTALAEDIANGKYAWVDGQIIFGTLDVEANNQEATATSSDILENKTAWVNKRLITGNIPVIARQDQSLTAGKSYTIPKGYHSGTAVISAVDLASQTQGTATEETILKGSSAWVNGKLINGTFDINEYIRDVLGSTNAVQKNVREGKTFYSGALSGIGIGTMKDYLNLPIRTLENGTTYTIPEGYYDGNSKIQVRSLRDVTQATATANDIMYGKSAWSNGELLNGVAHQNVTDASDTTAEVDDIRAGKTAYINGYKATGTNRNDRTSYFWFETSEDEPGIGVTIDLKEDYWSSVGYIRIDIYNGDNIVNTWFKTNYQVIEDIIDPIEDITIETDYGSRYIRITDKQNRKIGVTIVDFSINKK